MKKIQKLNFTWLIMTAGGQTSTQTKKLPASIQETSTFEKIRNNKMRLIYRKFKLNSYKTRLKKFRIHQLQLMHSEEV